MTYFKPLIKNFELFNALIQVSIAKGSLNFRTIHDKNTKNPPAILTTLGHTLTNKIMEQNHLPR
ncbi:hypothetical protein HPPC_05850 [Helicobacter pylori PeCan4]|uniref:Uncharacterized protein n=1 Tax=Helicobacter pylori X47-2AL TaxID=1386083 RepID=V6LAD9_HELPX|nr:hypothetical protein HPSH_06200 [Helicobacter pylori Shi470]ADI35267.1 Hypothetical protein HPV225_1226 [Helicobacter pylori v225d]ADO07380.1 hypothetical protein HPPC_05850 [Helicobacter pylori PeCan4]AFH98297.1 hypothetical protein HPSH417_05875 [Helicobacter pylori Shi417]AHZ27749.1 hypothetical protein EG66_00810 [Helicobacter pylori]EST40666.1 hypothetical protein N871_03360 [Helicobacter pylori X47-2AL]